MPTPQKINRELALLTTDTLVELYVLDATILPGGGVFYFAPDCMEDGSNIVWQSQTYTKFPVAISGMEFNSTKLPRPKIQFSNIGGYMTNLTLNFSDLCGAKLTRKRTFYRFLDGQSDADPTAGFPDDIFYIERKSMENRTIVEFELGSVIDVEGLQLPRRQVIADTCSWKYRSSECSFGNDQPVADIYDVLFTGSIRNLGLYNSSTVYIAGDFVYMVLPDGRRQYYLASGDGLITTPPSDTNNWRADQCAKSLNSCILRFGYNTPLPFGGFPGTNLMPLSGSRA